MIVNAVCTPITREEMARRPCYGTAEAARAAPDHVARDTSILNFSSGLRRA